ncbi:MAG: GreA/GreB family elongation factor [Candidatus Marinimicrobia bacterium]|nr:GreA/GreB family elongation factor [Candidatus Neomarinimicrobiota bacterium]MCF7828319.1 GreA/GreB family elongation factor [Candidatus Neomarinimicrobiota bacterium]MCF7879506.1 GreA/GreB family elongation factor [Candidatus Neomarinimicrobiota bacterium]
MAVAILKDTHELLRERIKELREEIDANKDDIRDAAAHGDLSENAEYDSAKEKQSMLHYKLNQLQMYMNVEIFDEGDINTDVVSFGTHVKIKNKKNGEVQEYNLVGPAEYELENYPEVMTYTSPLAKALMGKEVGETAEIKKPDKHLEFEVLEIESVLQSE